MFVDSLSISTLRRKAKRLGLLIRTDRRSGYYYLVDMEHNAVVDGPLNLKEVENRLAWEEDMIHG